MNCIDEQKYDYLKLIASIIITSFILVHFDRDGLITIHGRYFRYNYSKGIISIEEEDLKINFVMGVNNEIDYLDYEGKRYI